MTEQPARVAVALCDDLEGSNGHLDLDAVCRSLERSLPAVRARVVPGLCRRPERTPELASRSRAERLVFGLCAGGASRHEFQTWVRRAGLDPFALEVVGLPAQGAAPRDTRQMTLLLAAAVARARAFAGSEPEHLRPRLLALEETLSRRSLLTLPSFTYEAVPGVDPPSCLGARQCGLCVQACPAEAMRSQGGRIVVDKDRCKACGLCVVACPVDAIRFPGSSLPQYEAEVSTLLGAERPALLFTCRQAAATLVAGADGDGGWFPGWLPIEVPCLGMVTPGWVLQALAGGAQAVGLCSCGQGCRFCTESLFEDRAAFVRALLHLLGDESASERVRVVPAEREERSRAPGSPPPFGEPRGAAGARRIVLGEPAATVEAILALGERVGGVEELSLADAASPLGLVRLREETCTTCGSCADVCPTGALALEESGEEVVLSYDPTRCVPCRRCVSACPEAAEETLRVEAVIDLASLGRGRATLKRETLARCRNCGRPIAPRRMLGRLRELLGKEPGAEPLLEILSELCADCRVRGTS